MNTEAIVDLAIWGAHYVNGWCPDTREDEFLDGDLDRIAAWAQDYYDQCATGVEYRITVDRVRDALGFCQA